MFTSRKILITAAVGGAALLPPAAAAHAAPTTLAVEQVPTRVAAWNGTVMWSTFDPATTTYTLVKSVGGGAPVAVGVAPRGGRPFDIDLGSGRSGETLAVYSRRGDVYRLNVATGRETKMRGINSPDLVERDPTIQRGAIAFIRRSGGYDHLRIVDTNTRPQGKLIVKRRHIPSAELGEGHVAYVDAPIRNAGGAKTVHVRNLGTGADRSVYRAVSGGSNFANITKPTYSAQPQGFVWARTNLGSGEGNRLVRYTLADRKLAYAPGSVRYNTAAWVSAALGAVTSGSLDGSETRGACTDTGAQYCSVALSGPLQFR